MSSPTSSHVLGHYQCVFITQKLTQTLIYVLFLGSAGQENKYFKDSFLCEKNSPNTISNISVVVIIKESDGDKNDLSNL